MSVRKFGRIGRAWKGVYACFIRRHVAGIPKRNSIGLGTNLWEIISKFFNL